MPFLRMECAWTYHLAATNKVGMDVCSEVVNSYLALPGRNLPAF